MKKYKEKRPWGEFERFCLNEKCTVKILTIKKGGELSLQTHKKREEFWRVLWGRPKVIVNKKTKLSKAGDEFLIPKNTAHQIKAGGEGAGVLEISWGEFDENDEVRLRDKYRREKNRC